jgi:hypothetical protein
MARRLSARFLVPIQSTYNTQSIHNTQIIDGSTICTREHNDLSRFRSRCDHQSVNRCKGSSLGVTCRAYVQTLHNRRNPFLLI